MPAPLIEFAQFAHPSRWWLRRGPPAWLDDPRWFARAFRASLLLGVMGTVTGWLTVAGIVLMHIAEPWAGSLSISEFNLFLGPGLWFGIGVMMPLSRWLGRGWIMTLLAVPVSMFACYCGFITLLLVHPIMSSRPSEFPGGKDAAGFYAGFVGAAIVSLWMGHPLRKSAWLAGMTASLLASLNCGLYFLAQPDGSMLPLPGELATIIAQGWLYVGFQSLTAVGLGVRLWWVPSVTVQTHSTTTTPLDL